jgi:uncharacterized membrane protein YhaH (DUF805 family)
MKYFIKCVREYAKFSGRSRREEYWLFNFFNVLFSLIILAVSIIFEAPVIYLAYIFGMFIPSLAVTVRRLHDTGKSGWYYLVSLIPIVGSIWLMVLMCIKGDIGENQYGPDPKA